MRRADRLIQMTHYLRQKSRAVTAQQIATDFGICTRTVYRDIQCLMESHVPITGEAGVGYIIDKRYYLPPIAFDEDELEAIGLGISMVKQWTDQAFADKAISAFEKIKAVLPEQRQTELQQITTYSIPTELQVPWTVSFTEIRESIRDRRKVFIDYIDEKKQVTHRTLRPLALLFFNPVWLLTAWCEARKDFRNFRIDRIQQLTTAEVVFEVDADKSLEACMAKEQSCDTNSNL